jgi:hypothetical protein
VGAKELGDEAVAPVDEKHQAQENNDNPYDHKFKLCPLK